MKLFLSSIFFFFQFFCFPTFADSVIKTYIIKTSGIKVGNMSWEVIINNDSYSNKINIKSAGLLSTLYRFQGEYSSEGNVKKKKIGTKKIHTCLENKKNFKKNEFSF